MKIKLHHIITVLFLCTVSIQTVKSNEKVGKIVSVEFPDSDDKRVYFGAFRQNNSSEMKFFMRNLNPSFPLLTRPTVPTYERTNTDNSDDQFDMLMFKYEHNFTSPNPEEIILDESNPIRYISIFFVTGGGDLVGRKESRVLIGFASPENPDGLLHQDTFFFIGKYTEKFIDGFDDFVYFDSVFINQPQPIQKEWRVRNTVTEKLDVFDKKFTLLSSNISGNEFKIDDEKTFPLTFFPGLTTSDNTNFRSWNFGYSPVDTRPDTAEFRLLFHPFPLTVPDSVDTVKVRLFGFGVEHFLKIIENTNCEIFYDTVNFGNVNKIDTIDFGEVKVGSNKTAKVALRNIGTVNYRLKNQNIFENFSDEIVEYFSLKSSFCQNCNPLNISDSSVFEIEFSPNRRGNFTAKYVIENNFRDRKIKSNNPNDFRKTFVLRGVGVEPALRVTVDTVDFGNVSFANSNTECRTEKDTVITLRNVGNSELIISKIETDNDIAFQISPTTISIEPNSEANVRITFSSSSPERNITGSLFFTTNENGENTDTVRLIGRSIPPISAVISIPNLSNKPGTILNVPIYLTSASDFQSEVISYANSFNFLLSFNPTILSYTNWTTLNTAIAGILPKVESVSEGLLNISVKKEFATFLSETTLIILQFRTFIGNEISTELTIENPKIGNSVCDDFMNLQIQNGHYFIDSICGLPLKLNDISGLQYSFDLLSREINSNSLDFIFTLPFEIDVEISVYNSLGTEILSENYSNLSAGTFIKSLPLNLHSGVYYTVFTSGLFRRVVPLILR